MKKSLLYLLFSISSFVSMRSIAQQPFRCDGSMFVASYQNHRIYRIEFDRQADTVKLSPLENPIGFEVLAMGYSRRDNFIYGAACQNDEFFLCRIDSLGQGTLLKPIPLDTNIFQGLYAADVTPDGDELILFVAPRGAVENPNMSIIVDLTSPTFEMQEVIMTTLAGAPQILANDVIYHPLSELLYAHDIQGISNNLPNPHGKKTVIIDPYSGIIDNEIFFDNPPYGANLFNCMVATPFGEIFGIDGVRPNYGRWSELDPVTGMSTEIKFGDFVNYRPDTHFLSDGCSCPYTLAMEKTVDRDSTYGCREVVFTYRISNLMENNQEQVTFRDSFPPGFEVREIIYNPYPGNISVLDTNVIEITDMTLLYGIDSIQIKVWIPQGAEGTYFTQAFLINVDLSSTNQTANAIRSDYPPTIAKRDATPITVIPLEISLSSNEFEICPGSSIVLFPIPDTAGLQFLWGNGSTGPNLEVSEAGNYAVTVSGGCEKDSAVFQVIESPLSVSLGPDFEGQFGDQIELNPDVTYLSPITLFEWDVNGASAFACDTCLQTELLLLGDATVRLYIENQIGCHAMDELTISAIRKVYFPDAFSPNGDGINDWFYLQSKHGLEIKSFKIFDRWGGLVFEKENIRTNIEQNGWDGNAGSKQLQNGVYAWMAEVVFPDGVAIIYKGSVTIIK
ncbi:MAG TPA: gliding motility-associated C-terminal domain-containing protein [Bacteroidetes bacterium]|nr:gliding motility-associated C-terminal domain-containing protein [Bacteroidota bacterium]